MVVKLSQFLTPKPERNRTVRIKKPWSYRKYGVVFALQEGDYTRLTFLPDSRVHVQITEGKSLIIQHSEIKDYYE